MLSFSDINGTRPGFNVAALNKAQIHITEHRTYTEKKKMNFRWHIDYIEYTCVLILYQRSKNYRVLNKFNKFKYIFTLNRGVLTYMQQMALRLAYLSNEAVAPQLVHTRSHTPNTKM